MAKTIRDVADEAEDLIAEADQKRAAFLRENGWQYTSSTPGCYWMWCKVWQGKQWTYFKSAEALRAESWMQEMGDDAHGVEGTSDAQEVAQPSTGALPTHGGQTE